MNAEALKPKATRPMKNKPTYDAFAVRNHKGKTYWTRLGVVFISEKGGRVLMDGLPTQNPEGQYELVLLPYKERKAEAEQPEGDFEALPH